MSSKQNVKDEMNDLFAELVAMLSTSALQQLGKLVTPLTGKTEVNLKAAQISIDMLDMLKQKTAGNLTPDEDAMLNSVLASLQMNYVDVARKAPPESPDSQPPQTSRESRSPSDAQPDGGVSSAEKPPEKPPRFHKSYG